MNLDNQIPRREKSMRFDKWAVTAQEALQSSVSIAADAEAGRRARAAAASGGGGSAEADAGGGRALVEAHELVVLGLVPPATFAALDRADSHTNGNPGIVPRHTVVG